MSWAWHVARMGEDGYRVLVGKPEGKRPLGRPRRRWEDSIKMEKYIGVVWASLLAQDRDPWRTLMNMEMSLRVPQNVGKILSS
jgi:hypothetical protein